MATPIPDNSAPIARATLEMLAGAALPHLPDVLHGATTDTRRLRPGMLYVALRGETFDGHAFVAEARAAGAAACMVQDAQRGPDLVVVPDTLVAFGDLARLHLEALRRSAGTITIAITGSAGKTTTKEMTAALLARRGETHATRGNLNNRIGLPATILATPSARFLVLEAGMSLVGEMAELARIAQPDVAVVVNVGLAHAEGVGGREGVATEKGALYTGLAERGTAVVAQDDPFVVAAAARARADVTRVRFGEQSEADYRLLERIVREGGAELTLSRRGDTLRVQSPFAGAAQALDLLAALAMADEASRRAGSAELSQDEIEAALADVVLEGRGSRHAFAGGGFVVDDSYNANPDSMQRAVTLLGELAGTRRRVLVLGEMRELGPFAERAHEELGTILVAEKPDLVIGCGGLIDLALRRAEAGNVPVRYGSDAADAAMLATSAVLPEDAVLVKASRGVRAERVVHALRERLSER